MAKRRALVSVSDKSGIVEFCRRLVELDFEIVSTGGTLKTLAQAGVPATQVSDITGIPEILGGRVKTLHPVVFGGILARRNNATDMDTLTELGIEPIDIVAVNLYPFAKTVANPKSTDEEIIEQIDIGGPSLIRAAAKNHDDIYVVVDPADYDAVLDALASGRSADYARLRRKLAGKVFAHTSQYDNLIADYVSTGDRKIEGPLEPGTEPAGAGMPKKLVIEWPMGQELRYGENPHQAAAFYADPHCPPPSLAQCKQLQGKELSYNNYLDADTALEMIRELHDPACVILKHLNPCGAAWADNCLEAWKMALACDPTSAFGGIAGFNQVVDRPMAEEISKVFMEVIIAPAFSDEARHVFATKKNLRLLEAGDLTPRSPRMAYKSVSGGMLVQQLDVAIADRAEMKVVTRIQPTEEDWQGLMFANLVCKWVKSNAIVYADRRRTLGIGAGQMSRIDSANFGKHKASAAGHELRGCFMASDAFFPFRDVVDLAAKTGVRAIIQPGGSVRDEESIMAADEHGIAMVFTGVRHFRH